MRTRSGGQSVTVLRQLALHPSSQFCWGGRTRRPWRWRLLVHRPADGCHLDNLVAASRSFCLGILSLVWILNFCRPTIETEACNRLPRWRWRLWTRRFGPGPQQKAAQHGIMVWVARSRSTWKQRKADLPKSGGKSAEAKIGLRPTSAIKNIKSSSNGGPLRSDNERAHKLRYCRGLQRTGERCRARRSTDQWGTGVVAKAPEIAWLWALWCQDPQSSVAGRSSNHGIFHFFEIRRRKP